MASFNVTRRTLTLGAQDTTTGWYAKTFANSTIKMAIQKKGTMLLGSPMGLYARHDQTGFTDDVVLEGDEILDAASNYYQINAISSHYWGDSFYCYECELVKASMHADSPTTSGTWPTVNDPAYRQKLFLDTYITPANIKEDDNAANATFITALGMPNYPISRVFITKGVDIVYSIGDVRSTPMVAGSLDTYGYQHDVDIDLYAIDKVGLTARRVVYAGERELQNTLEDYPAYNYNLRSYNVGKLEPMSLGSLVLWHTKVTINYERTLNE